jgi:hypothetical protein
MAGYGEPSPESLSPAVFWKKADNWQLRVEIFPKGEKEASGSDRKPELPKPYSLFVSIVGEEKVGVADCWKVFFIPEKNALAAVGNMYCVVVDKASSWPRKVIRVKDPSAATLDILGEGAWVGGAPVGFPLECFPLLGPAKFEAKGPGPALRLERRVNGKEIVLEAKIKPPDGGESLVRQKWVVGEKWWREYDRWVNGRKDLHASRVLPPAPPKTSSGQPVSPPPWLHALYQDSRLRATLSVVQVDPPLPELFQKLEEATGLKFSLANEVANHAPKYGSVQFPKIKAVSLMKWMAETQLEEGRWEKTDTGYHLTAAASLSPAPAPPSGKGHPWAIAVLFLVIPLLVIGGWFIWRARRAKKA